MIQKATSPVSRIARLTAECIEVLPLDLPKHTRVADDEIALVFDRVPKGLNSEGGLLRTNRWDAKEIKEGWRATIHDMVETAAEAHYGQKRWVFSKARPAKQIVLYASTGNGRDWDNFGSALKYIQDALVFWGLLEDDGVRVFPRVEWLQTHARTKADERFLIWIVDKERNIWR